MSTTMTTQTAAGKSPCGCSGPKNGSPCGCGGAGCSSCQGQQFVRPRFFAGQLLTEDDLQSLTDYVAGKNRLHNRFLFGSGVVCGLQVKRDPCACGKVVVNPGYALDCCGNDIIVSCPQPLDINKMIRELKMKLRGGADCGDPCAGTSTNSTVSTNNATAAAAGTANSNATQSTDTPRTYCLYVDYCETPTDPVAPYATGGSCGAPTCEATRISEGFKFELRCPTKEDCDCSICKALEACTGPRSERTITANSALLLDFATSGLAAVRAIRKGVTPEYVPEAAEKALAAMKKAMDVKFRTQREVKVLALKIRDSLVAVAPLIYAETGAKILRTFGHDEQGKDIAAALKTLDEQRKQLSESLWNSYAGALANLADEVESQILQRSRATAEPKDIPVELQLLAHGAVVTTTYLKECVTAAQNLNLWLLEREDASGAPRAAKAKNNQIFSRSLVLEPELSLNEVGTIADETHRLLNAAQQHIKDCVCDALLPPCCTCTDTSVLLACITVQDCCVTEICNLDRKFVLSPTAIRYWVPELHELGESIEAFCCPKICEDDQNSSAPLLVSSEDDPSLFDLMGRSPALGEVVIASLLRGCAPIKQREPVRQPLLEPRGALASAFSRLAAHSPSSTPEAGSFEASTAADLQERLNTALADIEKLRADHASLAGRVQRVERRPRSGSESSGT